RREQVGGLGQGREERPHRQNRVIRADVDEAEDGVGLSQQIPVRQGNALGITGGPGGIHDYGDIALKDAGGAEVAGAGGQHAGQIGVTAFARAVNHDNANQRLLDRLFNHGKIFRIGEDDGGATVPEQLVDLKGGEGGVERHGGGAGGHYAEISSDPERPVARHDGAANSLRHARFPQPSAD